MAALPILYPKTFVIARFELTDEILTILPLPVFAISGPKTCTGIMVPHKLRTNASFIPSIFKLKTSSVGCKTPDGIFPPAPFTKPSILPYFPKISFFAETNCASSNTFTEIKCASPPFAFTSATLSFPFSTF